jgi:hypothetical protein
MMLLVSAFAAVAADALTSAEDSRLENLQYAQAVVSREVKQYFLDTGTYPTSLADLMGKPGYTHLKTYVSQANGGLAPSRRDLVQVQVSNSLNDGTWTFRRAAVFSLKNGTESNASYLGSTRNRCAPASGSTDFASGLSWCPATDNGITTRLEQRESASARLAAARMAQNLTLAKVIARYNTTGTFPAAASAVALRSVVTAVDTGAAVGTTSAQCTGRFVWSSIPLECSDLYNRFGQPVSYQLMSAKRVVLYSASTLTDNTGAVVTMATEVNLP